MVGRGHYGAPWAAGMIAEQAGGGQAFGPPPDITDYVLHHYDDMLTLYGVQQGTRHARKHLGWYLDRHAPETSDTLRSIIMTGTDPVVVKAALRDAFGESAEIAAQAVAA